MRIVAILCTLAAVIVTGCGKKDDTAAIRRLVDQCAQLAEAHEVGDLMRLATPDFVALPGRLNAARVKGVLFMAFQHYGKLKIHYPRPFVELAEGSKTATARIHFIIVSQNKDIPGLKELYENPEQWIESASEKADLYQMDLDLAKTDGDWRVKQVEIKGFKGWGF